MKRKSVKKTRFSASSVISLLLVCMLCLLQPAAPVMAEQAGAGPAVRQNPADIYHTLASGERVFLPRDYAVPVKPTVYLTFDDGPSRLTPKVLDILKREGIQATFFVLGELAEGNPKMIQRIVREGHSIGNHSYNHEYSQLYDSFDHFWGQIQKTEDILYGIAGIRPRLIRAPGGTFGHFDPFYFYYLDQAGYQVYDWNIDSGDSKRRHVPSGEMISEVEKGPFPHEIYLLMHDGSGHDESVKALPEIIRFFKQKGYVFAPLTPSVRPIMFHSGKLLHPRFTSLPTFERNMADVTDYERRFSGGAAGAVGLAEANLEQLQSLIHQSEVAVSESAKALQLLQNPPLQVRWEAGQQQKILDLEQYDLRNDSIFVPVRQFVEGMGGTVEWNEDAGTVKVRYGYRTMTCNIDSRILTVNSVQGTEERNVLAGVYLENGSVMIQLRTAATLLGMQIDDYSLEQGKREIFISQVKPPLLALFETEWLRMRSNSFYAYMNQLVTKYSFS
ncbi:polysaccharide deacetylase [Ferviditalea candida]|uniref:Polysaccharide deacetylase n=1 Tax=Ferviditalea candida TaxID=3108399 RepID=A0ABU5ZQX2_9BACL|nr:polysaccharide deacetylase [Paenibacillaceae bacterium T2]